MAVYEVSLSCSWINYWPRILEKKTGLINNIKTVCNHYDCCTFFFFYQKHTLTSPFWQLQDWWKFQKRLALNKQPQPWSKEWLLITLCTQLVAWRLGQKFWYMLLLEGLGLCCAKWQKMQVFLLSIALYSACTIIQSLKLHCPGRQCDLKLSTEFQNFTHRY